MKRILLIDDDLNFCEIVKLGLEARDVYHVIVAHDGRKGIKMAVEDKPELILLDVVMPKIEGVEVATILHEDPRTEHIPVLFVTSMVTEEELRKSTKVGGWYYLAKPIQINHLAETIDAILSGTEEGKAP